MHQWFLVWYAVSSVVLGLLLFLPVRKLMLALSVNRYQRRTQEAISETMLAKYQRRTTVIAAIVSMTFAFLYARALLFK